MKALHIWWLKRRLRALYLRIREGSQYSCGNSLYEQITGGRLAKLEAEFNTLYQRLKALDGNLPPNPLERTK